MSAVFSFAPFIGGSAIFASWIIVALLLRLSGAQLREVFSRTFHQMWGAMLVGVFIFGLAYVFNLLGMAASLANGIPKIGPWFIVVAPILVDRRRAVGKQHIDQRDVRRVPGGGGQAIGLPAAAAAVTELGGGAEIGKPIAPQTASVGVSTSRFVRDEGQIIRHNMGWTIILSPYS